MACLSSRLGFGQLGFIKNKSFSGWNGVGYYINGALSNLDQFGDNYFNHGPDPETVDSVLYQAGEFESWNGLFYQNGIPFTGVVEYYYYVYYGYTAIITSDTKTFVNGVNV